MPRPLIATLLTALILVWGTQFLVVKRAVEDVPPLLFGALRFGLVALVAQVAVWLTHPPPPPPAVLPLRLVYGLSHALGVGLLYWGQARVDSAVAAVLTASSPVLLALVAHRFIPEERLEGRVLIGSLVGLLGTALLVQGSAETATTSLAGLLAVLASAMASTSTKVTARRLTVALPTAVLLRDMGAVVAVALGLASLLGEGHLAVRWTPRSVAAVAWLGLVGSAAATGAYLVLLRHVAVARLGYLQFAHATLAVLVGVTVGDEVLGPLQWAGVGLVVVGGVGVTLGKADARVGARMRSP